MASHLLYTQRGVLDDDNPKERDLGIMAGLAWGAVAGATVVYTDRGITRGMERGMYRAIVEGRPVEFRSLADANASDRVTAGPEPSTGRLGHIKPASNLSGEAG